MKLMQMQNIYPFIPDVEPIDFVSYLAAYKKLEEDPGVIRKMESHIIRGD